MNEGLFSIRFNWSWIKDKTIEIDGNSRNGLIIISDSEGEIVRIIKYERR